MKEINYLKEKEKIDVWEKKKIQVLKFKNIVS